MIVPLFFCCETVFIYSVSAFYLMVHAYLFCKIKCWLIEHLIKVRVLLLKYCFKSSFLCEHFKCINLEIKRLMKKKHNIPKIFCITYRQIYVQECYTGFRHKISSRMFLTFKFISPWSKGTFMFLFQTSH